MEKREGRPATKEGIKARKKRVEAAIEVDIGIGYHFLMLTTVTITVSEDG